MSDQPDNMKPLNFVYQGRRFNKGKFYIAISVIQEDGTIEEDKERWFNFDRKIKRIIGGIYTGAEFNDTQAIGLKTAKYTSLWPVEGDRISWWALDDQAEAESRFTNLKNDVGSIRDLEKSMLAVRKQYDSARKRYDRATMTALENIVLRALTAPLRVDER